MRMFGSLIIIQVTTEFTLALINDDPGGKVTSNCIIAFSC